MAHVVVASGVIHFHQHLLVSSFSSLQWEAVGSVCVVHREMPTSETLPLSPSLRLGAISTGRGDGGGGRRGAGDGAVPEVISCHAGSGPTVMLWSSVSMTSNAKHFTALLS